ncbi:hypothetical protein ACFVFJ_46185 [Streptomyces sp. NPDC057717]|uniref:hypothetical protein n=1 Tax=Streptomyces sp. NPDC057717 TaxID=3346224 RepID=UPI0036874F89
MAVEGGVVHASLPGFVPGSAVAGDSIAAQLVSGGAVVDVTGYYLQGLPPSRPLLADWRMWPWPPGLDPFLLMAHSTPQNQLCLIVDGEARPVTDEALGSWLRALPELNISTRPLEDPVVALTCSTGAMRLQLADLVGRLVWFPHGEMTVGVRPLDAVGRAAGDKMRLGVRCTADGEGGRFRSSYPQGPAGDRVRFAYRSRFASRPADWLVERSAAPGTRAPAGLRPYPIGGKRALGLCYFDRRDRASRSSALAGPVLGSSYVAWTPNDAYQPGTSAHTVPSAGALRAAARPWHSRELGELPFDPGGVAIVVCYFADGLFAVYDEWQDLTYWETPLAFGRRVCKDLAAAQAAGPAGGPPPSQVLLLTDFDAISENARGQAAQGLGGPELITVNVPSTLFLDEDSEHGAPRARIALLPATSGPAAPVWTATTTAGTSTTLSPAPGDLGDRTNRALSEESSASAQDDVPSLVKPGTSFDEAAWREQSAAAHTLPAQQLLEWALKRAKQRRAALAGGAAQSHPPTVPPTQSSIVPVPVPGRPDMSQPVGGMGPSSHVSDLSASPSLLSYDTSAAETRPYAAPPMTSTPASGEHSGEAPQDDGQPPLARTEDTLADSGSAGMPATPSTSGSRRERTELRSSAQDADSAASQPASATHGTESADECRPSTGPLAPAEDQPTGQVGDHHGAEASVAAKPDMLPAAEEFVHLATNPVRATRRLNDSYEALRDFDRLITTQSAEPPGDDQGDNGESVVPAAIPTITVTPPMDDLPTIVVTPPTDTVPERKRHPETISTPDPAPEPASESGPEPGLEPAPDPEDGAPARPLSDPVLRFGTRRDGALELAHITPVPQASVAWLRERVIELVENGQGPDPRFRAQVRRVLTARLLSAEWARLISVAGLPLNVTYRKRRHPVSLRLGLTALGPSPQQLDHMPDGPPVSVQRWAFGINEAGDSGGSGDLRAFGHPFSHTWSVDKGPLRRITFTPKPSLTYNQLTTSVTVGTTVQPMVLIRSKGRHWPFDYAMTWELRRNDGPITSPLGTLPALGWEPAPGAAPDKLLVWFPTYLSTSEGLPDVDPARPESVPAPLDRLLDEVPLFGPQALADHAVLFADVLRSFADPLGSLSEGSRRELFEFFGEGNVRSNLPQTWGGSVASPTLYTSSGEAIGYLRIGAELTGGDTITGPTTASSVLETYILRSLRMQGSAQISNGAGLNVSITLGFGTGATDPLTGVEPLGGQFTFQFGGQHQFTHVLTSGGSARIAHSLRTATPLLQVTPRMRLRITLVHPDSAPLGPTAGSPLDGGKHYPVVMLVPSLDALGHVPTQTRYLPPEVLHLKQLGVSTTPLQVSGTSPLFDQAERWLRDNGFLPSDRPETRRWDKAMDQAIRTQRLNNLRKLDQMRSRLGLRSALDEMIEGGDTTWFELPTPLGTQRVSVRLVTERRYAAPDANAGVEHQRTLPKIQTLNYTGSTIAGDQQFQSTPFAWNVGGEGAVSNPLDGDQRLQQIRPHYSYTSQTTTNTGSSTGTGHEYYMLSPTENGTQVFAVPVTHRMVITHSHGPNPEPVSADGSVRLAVPTFRTLDRPSPAPRPGPATVRDHSHQDDRLLALPNPGRTFQEGVLRLPETALLDRVGGSADLRREVLAMIKDIEHAVAEENERYVMPPTPGAWIEDEDDVEAQDTATGATVEPRTVPRPWSSPLLRAVSGLIAGSAHWVSGSVADAGRWVWRASVGEPATDHESSANEVADTALSPHHLSANALRIFRDSYPVEGAATPGVLAGTDFTIEVRGYLTDVRVLPQPPKLDAERWLQSTDASASTRNRQAGHQGGLSLAGRYGGKDDAVAPQGGLQARIARTDGVTVNDNTGVFRVTTEDTTAAFRFTAKAHYVVTVRSGARNLVSGTVAPGLGGLNRTRVVELPDGVEFLLVDNDLQNHPDLAALVAEAGQTSAPVGPSDRRLPAWYVDSGGTIGAGVVTEVHTAGGRSSFQRRIHRLVQQEAPGVTTPGHAAYMPGVLTRINEHSTSLGLRTLVNAGPQGHTAFHFVHRSWLGPRLVEVALVARPAPGQDLSARRGKRVTTTSGMDNVFGHSHGDGTALEVPGATRISSTRTISGQVDFAPLGESNGEQARSTLSLARQSNRSDAQSSSRELRSWQRTFGNTSEFPVPYEYDVRVSSRPLTESLVGLLADLIGSGLDLAAVFVLPLPLAGLFPASRIGRREVEPATAVLRFNASETPDRGERLAATIPPAVFTTNPSVPRPTPPPGGVAVEMEVPADLRVLLSGPAWVPARPIEIYDFGGMDELRDALRAVDHSLKDTSRPQTTTSAEGMLIRLTSLAQSNRLTPLEPAAVAPFLGHPGGTGVSMKITLYSPRAEVTSKDTAIDRIELSADGFQTQADNTITPSLGYNHSSRYGSADRGGPTVPVVGDRAMLGQNASSSSQRRELLRFGTPMANAKGEGLDGHRVRAVALVEVHGPSGTRWVAGDLLLRTTETPPGAGRSDRTAMPERDESEEPGRSVEEVQRLLQAEAERRGVSGPELLDQLAREGRYTGLVDTDPQGDLTEWTTTVVDRSGIARGGEEKTVSVQPLVSPELFGGGPVTITDDTEGAVIMGPLNSGKSNAADHTPAQLDAAGLSYEERAVTNDGPTFRVIRSS